MYEVDSVELRKKMIEQGFDTIDSFSEACGVNRNTLADVVKGRAFPSAMVMTRIGETLNIKSEDMGAIFFKPKLA